MRWDPNGWSQGLPTNLAASTLVIERAKGDGGQQDGDVKEDGCGQVLQQRLVATNNP